MYYQERAGHCSWAWAWYPSGVESSATRSCFLPGRRGVVEERLYWDYSGPRKGNKGRGYSVYIYIDLSAQCKRNVSLNFP